MTTQIQHFQELGYTVVMEKFDHFCKFNIFQINHIDEYDGDDDEIEHEYFYEKKNSNNDYTSKVEDAIVFMRGSVKSDECSNWVVDNDNVMIHGCSSTDLLNIGKILEACHHLAMKEMQ